MRGVLFLLFSLVCFNLSANESHVEAFDIKIYTPEVVFDSQNQGAKGAVQLLWQKKAIDSKFEVEVSRDNKIYRTVLGRHFHHVMLYYGSNYQWRVREIKENGEKSTFSVWRSLTVKRGVRGVAEERSLKQEHKAHSIDEFLLDTGD